MFSIMKNTNCALVIFFVFEKKDGASEFLSYTFCYVELPFYFCFWKLPDVPDRLTQDTV